jgi:hypothetical protein
MEAHWDVFWLHAWRCFQQAVSVIFVHPQPNVWIKHNVVSAEQSNFTYTKQAARLRGRAIVCGLVQETTVTRDYCTGTSVRSLSKVVTIWLSQYDKNCCAPVPQIVGLTLNVILPSARRSSEWSLAFRFSDKSFVFTYCEPYMLSSSYHFWLDRLNNRCIWWRVKRNAVPLPQCRR